ncbi:hypothetical protein [Streptomyces sp. TLI_185]|uniref:hypothetical protein n=1 Tax=Streptomyces sp. TLI_185 TaxID=2485151 RepID=UPI000F4D81A3|nr:hypothetical protein [Streptomyces sp. TLI_185]
MSVDIHPALTPQQKFFNSTTWRVFSTGDGIVGRTPTTPVVDQEIDAHLARRAPGSWASPSRGANRLWLEMFFALSRRGKGSKLSACVCGCHFTKTCRSAGLVDVDGRAKYTPRSLRHFVDLRRAAEVAGNNCDGVPGDVVDSGAVARGVGPLHVRGPVAEDRHATTPTTWAATAMTAAVEAPRWGADSE